MILEAAKDVLLDGQVLWTKGERRETDDPEEIAKLRSQGFVDAGTIEPGVREAVDSVFHEGLDFSDPTGQHSTPVYVAKAAVQGAASSLAHGVAGLEKGAVGGVLDLASAGARVLGNGAAADQLQEAKRRNEQIFDAAALDDLILGDAFDNSREAWEKVMGVSEGLGHIAGGVAAAKPFAAGLKAAKVAKTAEGAMKAAFTAQMAAGGEEAARTQALTKKDERGNPVVDENGQPVIENRDLTWRERAEVGYHTAKEAITAQFFGRVVGAFGKKIGNAGAAALEFGGINAAGVLADAYIGDNIAGREWKDEDGNVLVGNEKDMAVLQKMGAEFLYGGMQSLLMSMGGAIAGTEKRLADNRRKAVKDAMERPKVVAVGANGERVLEGGALVRVAEDGAPEVVTPYGVVLDAEGKVKTVTAGNVGETGEGAYGTDVKVRVDPLTGRPTAARETVRNALIALQEGVTIDQLRESDGWTPENKAVFETVARLKQGLAEGMPAGELVDALAGLGIGERDARAFGFIPEGNRYVGDALAVANNGTRSLQNAVGNGGPGHIPLEIAAEVARSVNAGTTGLMPKELAKRQLETARQLMAERAKAKLEESAAEHGNTPEAERAVLDTPVEKPDGTLTTLGEMTETAETTGTTGTGNLPEVSDVPEVPAVVSLPAGTTTTLRARHEREQSVRALGIKPLGDGSYGVGRFPQMRVEKADGVTDDTGMPVKALRVTGLDPAEMLRPENILDAARVLGDLMEKCAAKGVRVDFEPEAVDAVKEVMAKWETDVRTDPVLRARSEVVTSLLEKSGLASGIVTDQAGFEAALREKGGARAERLIADGQTYGFVDPASGTVYLNPAFFGTKQGLNTPIHEFGHLGIVACRKINRPLYDRGVDLIKQTKYWKEVVEHPDYRNDSPEKNAEEALTRLIADRGEKLSAETPKGVLNEIKQWLVDFWKTFGNALGLREITPEQVEKMTVEQIADAIRAEMLRGERFGTTRRQVEARQQAGRRLRARAGRRSPAAYVEAGGGKASAAFMFWAENGRRIMNVPKPGEFGWDLYNQLVLGQKDPAERARMKRLLCGDQPKNTRRKGNDEILAEFNRDFGGEGDVYTLESGFQQMVEEFLSSHADYERWRAEGAKSIKERHEEAEAERRGSRSPDVEGLKPVGEHGKGSFDPAELEEWGRMYDELHLEMAEAGLDESDSSLPDAAFSRGGGVRVPKQEYARISSQVAENEAKAAKSGVEHPPRGVARTSDGIYIYDYFSDTTFSVRRRLRNTPKNDKLFIAHRKAFDDELNRTAASIVERLEKRRSGQGHGSNDIVGIRDGAEGRGDGELAGGVHQGLRTPSDTGAVSRGAGGDRPENAAGDIKYSIGGVKGASQMGIKGAGDAEAMEKAGKDREEIWRTTGWWRGKDGQWRFELPSTKMKDARALYAALVEGHNETTLGKILDAPKLFEAYPQLKDTKIVLSSDTVNPGEAGGWYDRIKNEIVLFDTGLVSLKDMPFHERDLRDTYQKVLDSDEFVRRRLADMDAFGIEHGTVEEEREYARWWINRQDKKIDRTNETRVRDLANDRRVWSAFGKIIHEVQHAVQRIEGFASGASGEEDGYSRFAGEVEARNSSRREAMSPEERAATPPWATEDVPEDRQIIRFSRALAPSALGDGKQKYYEVPFDKAVDVIVANRRAGGKSAKKISNDFVFVGETPSALTEIGFVKMPVMMTQHHIETCYFTKKDGRKWKIGGHMHGLGDVLKKVPEALKKPVMVIASRSPTGKDTSVVAITSVPTPKGDMIVPVIINGEPNVDGGRISAHIVASAHGRENAWKGLVKEAIDVEEKGGIGVFFVDKAKASKVFTSLAQANPQLASAGLKYAKKPQGNGVLHSIHDPGSPVKAQAAKISSQTQTLQFKEFFGDAKKDPANASKVVDENGEPLVVYHETGNDFTVFDPRHEGAGGRDYETPFGIFLKPSPKPLGVARGDKAKQMALYANIRNPMQFANRKELDDFLRSNCEGYAQAADAIKNIDTEYKKRLDAAEQVEDEAMMDIYRNHPEIWNDDAKRMETVEKYSAETKRILEEWKGAADRQSADLKEITDQFFRSSGHDGIVLESDEGSFGRKTKTYIAFDPTQVKSATDNIGTFDPGNPDIRFSRGGYKPGDWRKTFTFGKAARGAAEQTNGGLAAGEERRRWEENPVDERIPEWDAPARNPNVAKPFALSSAEGVRLVKLLGGTMKKPKAYKDAIGVIDESDEQRIREDLKAMGFFKSDDYLWAATSDPATVAADRADSQAALDARLEKLGEQRLKGEAGGGNRGLVRVSMSQVADLVLSLPAETGGNLGNVRTLAQGIVRGFERDRTPEQAAYFLQEAQGLLDWFYGHKGVARDSRPAIRDEQGAHEPRTTNHEPRKVLARAFGAFLEAPDAVAERAPGLYREFVDAISRNDKLLHAFDAIRRTALGEGSAERVYAEIEAGRTARAEEAARRLADEAEKPIGSRLERAKDSFVYNFDDMHGPIFMHITRAQKRQLAELKASLKAGRITQADYDAATAAFRQAVQGLKIAELKVDRGTQNEIRQYLWDMSFVFEQAKAAGVDPKDAQRYMDLRWIVSTGGRAGARGMSARDAQIVLDNMKRNMGDEAFARLEGVSAQFHAVREKNILDDPRLAAMIGQDRVDYFKNNVHYVRTERTRATPEELAKMEADRAAFRRENKGDDDVTAAMLSLLDKTGGRGGGIGNSTWGHALEGSVKDVKDRLAATWRNDTRLMAAMERNDFVLKMRDALLAAKAEGVHDLPGSRGVDYPQNARYGHIRYFENGRQRVLVVPRVLADGYRQVSDAMTGWSAWGKIAHGVFIDWNLAYTLRNMTRNMASNESNIVGMRADNATIVGNALLPGAGRAASMAAYQVARHLPEWVFRNPLARAVFGEHVNAAYAGQAQRILELYLDPRKAVERRAAAEEARLRGETGPAMELDADLELMRFMTKSGALIARWDEVHGAGRDADLFMQGRGLGPIYGDAGASAPKSRAHKILARARDIVSYPFRRNAQFNRDLELHAKITAALAIHEMQPGLTAEQVGIEVARRASIPHAERRGANSKMINYAWNMFFNTALKGGQRFVGNIVRNPRLAGKMAAQSLGPQLFWATMIAGGGLAAVIRNMFGGGDDAEEKARQAGLGGLLDYAQLMHDGAFAASPYLQRFYHWCPLGQVGERYIGIALPRTDEEKMLLPFIDWAAAKFAPQPTDPTATLGDAVKRGVVGTFVPDLTARTPLVAAAQDLVFAWWQNPMDTYRGTHVYDNSLWQARGESVGDAAAFAWATAKQGFNDLGGRTIVRPRRNEIEVAEGSGAQPPSFAEKAWDFALNDIPVLSGVLGGTLRMTLTKEQRLDQVEREALAPIRAVKNRRSEEIMKMMLESPVANNGSETPEIKEKLDAWAQRYGWDEAERVNVFARAFNGYQAATAAGKELAAQRKEANRQKRLAARPASERRAMEAAGLAVIQSE